MYCGWSVRCSEAEAESVHHQHQDPGLQDRVVLHGDHDRLDSESQTEEAGHGQVAKNSQDSYHV